MPPADADAWVLGGWVMITTGAEEPAPTGRIEGELLAAGEDSVFVLTSDGLLQGVGVREIRDAEVWGYKPDHSALGIWTFVGTLSTLSHGVAFVLSAPVWLLAGISATASRSREPRIRYPTRPISEFSMYARYPQGMPPGFPRSPDPAP